jgi:ribosome maturation factor RimP
MTTRRTGDGLPGGPAEGVRALAGAAVESAGLVLEDVVVTPAGRRRQLRVVVDLPQDRLGGVPMDAVAKASQALSEALDASDVMGGQPYVLEVSSPGADRALTERRHWSRSRRRLVKVQLADGTETTGRLVEVDDDGILLDDRRLSWADVTRGRVELEFGPVDGIDDPDGDDPDGDDDDPDGDDPDGDDLDDGGPEGDDGAAGGGR